MHIVNEAHSKLILFGEHAAVYGYSAIGLGLPWKVKVSLMPSDKMQWSLPQIAPQHRVKLDALLQRLLQLFPSLSVALSIESDLPIGVGLGSSGSLCVALTQCLFTYLEMDKNTLCIWKTAHELEKVFHATPSGIDTGLSLHKKLCSFKKGSEELPECQFLTHTSLHLVIGALPRESDTKSLVANLRNQKENNRKVEILIGELGRLADQAIQEIQKPAQLGKLATEAHLHLNALGLSTHTLNALLDYAISQGALGGKLSGAGGGGAYYLITESAASAEILANDIKNFALAHNIKHLLTPTTLNLSQ